MKNIDIKELIVIGVGISAFCFAVSKFVLCKFQMQTDFLSASATIFAAIIAIKLFNDWREEYLIEKMERFHVDIEQVTIALNAHYKIIDNKTIAGRLRTSMGLLYVADEIDSSDMDGALRDALDNLQKNLRLIHQLLTEYEIFLINYNTKTSLKHSELVKEKREKVFELVMKIPRVDGVLSTKTLLEFICNTLILKLDLREVVFDLSSLAYSNRTSFFYKMFNK